jgi:thiol-disulfide isomerase/thioredoxin
LEISQWFDKRSKCLDVQSTDMRNTCIEELNVQKEKLINTRDSIFYDYVIHHRNSNINIWYLFYLIRNTGYNVYYEKAFHNISGLLSKDLKYYFENLISIEKQKAVAVTFPLLDYLQLNTSKDLFLRNKYILVDFWFSGCSPCLYQFSHLKNIYKNYRDKKFEIIAISTDSKDNIKDYKELLKTNMYQWKQVLDTAGVISKSISIHAYPTNFLLDEKGKIIAKDLSPEELEKFLAKKLI